MADYPVKDGEGNTIIESATSADVPGAVSKDWLDLPLNTYGEALELPNHSDKTISFDGTFGGALSQMFGSNDVTARTDPASSAKFPLVDDDNVAIESNGVTDKGFVGKQNPRFIFPYNSGGDGTTAVNIRVNANRK